MSSSRDEYLRQMQAAQNVYQHYNQMAGLGQQSMSRHPLEGYDISAMSLNDLQRTLSIVGAEYDRRMLDSPLPSPTQRMLNESESLRNAWSEFMTIWKLVRK